MSSKTADLDRDAKILRASLAGLTTGALSRRFNLSPNAIRAAVARAKIRAARATGNETAAAEAH